MKNRKFHEKSFLVYSNSRSHRLAQSYPLKPIPAGEYAKRAKRLFQKKGVSLDERHVRDIVVRCGAKPSYVQKTLFELWRRDKIDDGAIAGIEKDILTQKSDEFTTLWNLLTQNQKKALRQVSGNER